MSAVRLGSKYDQIRVSSQTGLQFCRLPVRPDHRPGSAHSRPVGNPSGEIEVHERPSPVYGSTIHVLDRPPDGHRVCAGRLHMRPIQWHLKKNWHVPEVLEKIIPVPQSLHPHLDWLDEANVLKGQPLHPLQHTVKLFMAPQTKVGVHT